MKTTILLAIATLLLISTASHATGAGAIILEFNTSGRFEGMGGAGVGAPWGSDTNHWANPALLAFRPGVNYQHYRSELAQGLADDISLTNSELTLGAYGVTLLWGRGPVDGNFLDMGEQTATDENGMPTGSFRSYMKDQTWGLGLDLVRAFDFATGREADGYARYASLALGFTRHEFEDQLAPDSALQDTQGGGGASGSVTDKGLLLRITPLRNDKPAGWNGNGVLGFEAGAAYGLSILSDTGAYIVHVDADQSDPFPRRHVSGWSLRLAMPLAPDYRDRPRTGFGRIFAAAIDPFLSFVYARQKIQPGYVWDEDEMEYFYRRDKSDMSETTGSGWELGLANMFYLRRGHVEMPWGDIDADTSGWGINLQAGPLGGFRVDHARVPQATGLPSVHRRTWSLWIDPVAIAGW